MTASAPPQQRGGFRFSASGQHAACLVGAGFGTRWVEAWSFGDPVTHQAVAGGEPQVRTSQVLALDDGQVLLCQPGGDVHRILVSTLTGPWRTLAELRCPAVSVLPHPASGALALTAVAHPDLATTVWRVAGDEPAPREVARLPGLLTGGTWLDDAGTRLALTQVHDGRIHHLVVDIGTGQSAPLPGLGAEVRPVLAAPSSGLLVVTQGRARCGWTLLDGSRPVTYPAALVSTPRRRVWPMALDPAGRRVLLRIDEHRRCELAVYHPAADRLEPLDTPPGVVGALAHWAPEHLRFPFVALGGSSGVAELRGGPGGPFVLHGTCPPAAGQPAGPPAGWPLAGGPSAGTADRRGGRRRVGHSQAGARSGPGGPVRHDRAARAAEAPGARWSAPGPRGVRGAARPGLAAHDRSGRLAHPRRGALVA